MQIISENLIFYRSFFLEQFKFASLAALILSLYEKFEGGAKIIHLHKFIIEAAILN